MSETSINQVSKKDYWQSHIQRWQESKLSQSRYCEIEGIKLGTFTYWRGLLLTDTEKKINKKFAAIKIISQDNLKSIPESISIKLQSGHLVYIPIQVGMKEVASLIRLLGSSDA